MSTSTTRSRMHAPLPVAALARPSSRLQEHQGAAFGPCGRSHRPGRPVLASAPPASWPHTSTRCTLHTLMLTTHTQGVSRTPGSRNARARAPLVAGEAWRAPVQALTRTHAHEPAARDRSAAAPDPVGQARSSRRSWAAHTHQPKIEQATRTHQPGCWSKPSRPRPGAGLMPRSYRLVAPWR